MNDKVALVTGASSGIGLAITNLLLDRGFRVVGVARHASATLRASERLVVADGDVGQVETSTRAVAEATKRFGRLDLLVNNAGLFLSKPFTDYDAEDQARLVSTNLTGFVHATQAALRVMAPARRGHVVNIGTSFCAQPIAGVPSALPVLLKGGIEAATRALAIEYADRGVRVNTIAAGIIDTPMHDPKNHAALASLSPAKRIGTAREVADAVLYLEEASFVSGEILHLDGGAHAGKWS